MNQSVLGFSKIKPMREPIIKTRKKRSVALESDKSPSATSMLNLDEWHSITQAIKRVNGLSDDKIYIRITDVANTMDSREMSITFGKVIYDELGINENENSVFVMQHDTDPKRFLIFRSPNGNRVQQPNKTREYFCLKYRISKKSGYDTQGKIGILFIVHRQANGNASVIEFSLP
jgi:hypothetical protein